MARRFQHAPMIAALSAIGFAAVACRSGADSPASGVRERRTEAALVSAVRDRMAATSHAAGAPEDASSEGDPAALQLPAMRVVGSGATARLEVTADENHQSPAAARTEQGWAVTWGDREHTRAILARVDSAAHADGAPVILRQSSGEEEDVWPPAVAYDGHEFGVSWSDPANGTVRFQRVDLNGSAVGRAAIVHDGLEMPLYTRVAWTGTEFGVAVALHDGVYFTRVDRAGNRLGDGVVLAEGTGVGGIDDFSAGAGGFTLTWHEAGAAAAQHRVRLGHNGQPLQTASAATPARARRVASSESLRRHG